MFTVDWAQVGRLAQRSVSSDRGRPANERLTLVDVDVERQEAVLTRRRVISLPSVVPTNIRLHSARRRPAAAEEARDLGACGS